MNCEDFREKIELYVLGGAGEAESQTIEEHLSKCTDCRQIEQHCVLLLTNVLPDERSSFSNPQLVGRILSATEFPLKKARIQRGLRRFLTVSGSIAAVLTAGILIWQVWASRRDENAGSLPRQAQATPAAAVEVWHKGNAFGMGFTNADDLVVDNGTVYFLIGSDSRPVVAAVNAESGHTIWQSDLVSSGYLETDDNHLYCVAMTGRTSTDLAALDIRNGQIRWIFERGAASNRLCQPSKPTVINTGRVCWVCDNMVYVLNPATGDEIWRRAFEGEGALSRAAAVGDCIYAAGRNGIYCMDAQGGELRWHMPCRFYTWPGAQPLIAATESDTLFVAAGSKDGRSVIRSIDVAAQLCLWERVIPRATRIYADSAHVYIRCQDVLALDRTTGRPVWSIEAAGCSPITEYDNMICYVDRTEEGRLVAVHRHTGREVWQISGVNSCDAFVGIGRRGYLVTDDREVLALAFDL